MAAITYLLFILANLKPIAPILFPASALLGVGAALLWSAQGVCVFGVFEQSFFVYSVMLISDLRRATLQGGRTNLISVSSAVLYVLLCHVLVFVRVCYSSLVIVVPVLFLYLFRSLCSFHLLSFLLVFLTVVRC